MSAGPRAGWSAYVRRWQPAVPGCPERKPPAWWKRPRGTLRGHAGPADTARVRLAWETSLLFGWVWRKLVGQPAHDGCLDLIDPIGDFRVYPAHFLIQCAVVGSERLAVFVLTECVVGHRFEFADSLDLKGLFLCGIEAVAFGRILICGLQRFSGGGFGR